MYDNIYYCRNAENTCSKKDSCLRYLDAKNNPVSTLFKYACTEKNNYVLYIHKDVEIKAAEGENANGSENNSEQTS